MQTVAQAALSLALAFGVQGQAAAGPLDTIFGSPTNLPPSAAVEPLADPPAYRSENGVLSVALEAKPARVRLGRFEVNAATYNGVYGGPVLRVKPGDVLRLKLTNHLAQATNIHFHGLAVSPQGRADNSMHMVMPGESWDYEVPIPKDHPPGVYWYHTHAHSFAERQLMGGLSGTLIVEGFQDKVPATRALKERVFALKEFQADPKGDLARVTKAYNLDIKTINGQLMPRIDIQPGETQLWRFIDQTANTFFRLSLEGHSFTVVGRDSQAIPKAEVTKQLFFGPSERIDVLVTGGPAGSYRLVSERTWSGPAGDFFPAQNLGLMVSTSGGAVPAPLAPLTVAAGAATPIPGERIDAQRLVSFSQDGVTGLFFINHQIFDHGRVDVRVPLGAIEEWTVRNSSDELHLFHIHQVPFQVVSVNGKAEAFSGLMDTVTVPIHGEVKIRLAFTNPAIVGRFMFHCHILEHEDKGMMAQIEVYDPKVGPMPDGPMPEMDHSQMPAPVAVAGAAAHASH